jgi:hypothetical protein
MGLQSLENTLNYYDLYDDNDGLFQSEEEELELDITTRSAFYNSTKFKRENGIYYLTYLTYGRPDNP